MTSVRVLSILLLAFGHVVFADDATDEFLTNGVTAHRGNSGDFPENTLPAFRSGIEVGADWIELDIFRTKDGKLQASILDSVREEANDLSKRVNHEDKDKLDEYFTSIRDVEKRLELRQRWANLPKPKPPFDQPSNTNTVEDLPMLYELIALALQTDSTRVATLEIGGDFLPQDLGIDKSYHGLSHHGNQKDAIADLITLEKCQMLHSSKFLTGLSKIEDGEQTLLDSTAVLNAACRRGAGSWRGRRRRWRCRLGALRGHRRTSTGRHRPCAPVDPPDRRCGRPLPGWASPATGRRGRTCA